MMNLRIAKWRREKADMLTYGAMKHTSGKFNNNDTARTFQFCLISIALIIPTHR